MVTLKNNGCPTCATGSAGPGTILSNLAKTGLIIQFCVLKLETTILTGQYDYWPAIIGFLILMFKDTIISLRIFYPNFHLFLSVTNVLYTPVAYLLANGIEANH